MITDAAHRAAAELPALSDEQCVQVGHLLALAPSTQAAIAQLSTRSSGLSTRTGADR